MRIAIVNDLAVAMEVLRRIILSVSGHEIAWVAGNGEEAVERSASDTPDLILMDLMMPIMDGGEVFRVFKQVSLNVKVIICSGYSIKGKVENLMEQGIDAFIQKPFVYDELLDTISRVLKR